jgi:hypothetical protein
MAKVNRSDGVKLGMPARDFCHILLKGLIKLNEVSNKITQIANVDASRKRSDLVNAPADTGI